MLTLSAHLPEVAFGPGEAIVREGSMAGDIWVLVSGALRVSKGGVAVNVIDQPGAVVGEISVLLGLPCTATVQASERSVLRRATDGKALLEGDPGITSLIAVGLAERLNFVTTYLADLKQQYGDAPGLAMIPDVLRELGQRHGPVARPGSAREPDPEY